MTMEHLTPIPSTLPPCLEGDLLARLPKLRAFANSLCGRSGGHAQRAEDLVQETVARALANIRSFVPGTNMNAWLRTILRNEFYSEYRKHRREVQDVDGVQAAKLWSHPAQEGHVHFLELRDAMDKLRPEHRDALILVGASGLSYQDAAQDSACAVGTMKSRVNRARAKLTVLLDQPEQGGEANISLFESSVATDDQMSPLAMASSMGEAVKAVAARRSVATAS